MIRREADLLFGKRGAEFSDCGGFRYSLWHYWEGTTRVATYLMLNPSKANETENDPTVERCYRRAKSCLDCTGMRIVNLFARIATDPKELYAAAKHGLEVVGLHNDRSIIEAISGSTFCIAGWGKLRQPFKWRASQVIRLLESEFGSCPLKCLGKNSDGSPIHPLYVPYEQQLTDL